MFILVLCQSSIWLLSDGSVGLKHVGWDLGDGYSFLLLLEQLAFVVAMDTRLGAESVLSEVERFIVVLAGEELTLSLLFDLTDWVALRVGDEMQHFAWKFI